MKLAVDLRMLRHSGIGRYLRSVFPLVLERTVADRVSVLGPRSLLEGQPWLSDPRVTHIETGIPVYSPGEQKLAFLPAVHEADVLWVPHFNAPMLRRGKTVVTIHDLAYLAMPELLGRWHKRAYAKLLMTRAVRHASAILAVSEFTRGELVRRLHVDAAKITVTPLGLDPTWPSAAEPSAEASIGPYFLFVGNVKPNKNVKLLLEAFALVQHQLPQRIVLAGKMEGFITGDASALALARSMGDRVHMVGEVSDEELQRLYAGATALVMPSLYEGFGLPLLEAMQLGCPVLASTANSLVEVGGEAALYFDPREAEQLAARLMEVAQPETQARLRALGRQRATEFSIADTARRTAAVLNAQMGASA